MGTRGRPEARGLFYLEPEVLSSLKLYAYCGNDPIDYVDRSGHVPKWLQALGWIGLAVGAVFVIGAMSGFGAGASGWYNAKALAFPHFGSLIREAICFCKIFHTIL